MPKTKKRTKFKRKKKAKGYTPKAQCPKCSKPMLCHKIDKVDRAGRAYTGNLFICENCELRFDEQNIWERDSQYNKTFRKHHINNRKPKRVKFKKQGGSIMAQAEKKIVKKIVKKMASKTIPQKTGKVVIPKKVAKKTVPVKVVVKGERGFITKHDYLVKICKGLPKTGRTLKEIVQMTVDKCGGAEASAAARSLLGFAVKLDALRFENKKYYKV